MHKTINVIVFALLVTSISFVSLPTANARCQNDPESVTPIYVDEHLDIYKLMQEMYEAAWIAKRLQEEQKA